MPTTNVATTFVAIAPLVIPRPCNAGATAAASASKRGPKSMPNPRNPMMFATTPAASPPTTTFEVLMAMLLLRLEVKGTERRGLYYAICWWLVVGGWWLVVGGWWLVVDGW